jgi:hypothetical protein
MNRTYGTHFVGVWLVEAVQKRRHPALDAGTPLLDNSRRCRIRVRHDDIDDDSNLAPFLGSHL